MEANVGFDIIPEGKLNFGNSSYQVTVFAGTIFIPDYKNATKQINTTGTHSHARDIFKVRARA